MKKKIEFLGSLKVMMILVLFLLLCVNDMYAQGGIGGGLQQAANQIGTFLDPLKKLIYAAATLVALYGGFRIYNKIQSGDQDVYKSLGAWVGGVVFLIVLGLVIDTLFNM